MAKGLHVVSREADVEDPPFPDPSFAVVRSNHGVMSALEQERAACEAARVRRRDKRMARADWTPEGFPQSWKAAQ